MKMTVAIAAACLWASTSFADPLNCNLSGYKPMAGLTATVAADVLTLTWDSERGEQVRVRYAIDAARGAHQGGAVERARHQPGAGVPDRIGAAANDQPADVAPAFAESPTDVGDHRSLQVGCILGRAA